MKYFLTAIFISCLNIAIGQTDTSISLDQLHVPSSPAFTILGISPNSIEKPKNPTDFALALGNATSGFSTIPKDYAIEFAPFWLFGKKQTTFKEFISNVPKHNIRQTATISAATTSARSQVDSSEFRKIAVALKFSVFRGEVRDEFKKWNDSVSRYLGRVAEIAGQINADFNTKQRDHMIFLIEKINDPGNTAAQKKAWQDSLKIFQALLPARIETYTITAQKLAEDSVKEVITILQGLASRTDFKRYGFKLDFAAGSAMDYPDSTFQNCYVSKVSAWITFGWENPNFNFLVLGRFSENLNHKFLNDSNKVVRDINMGEFDWGFRIYKDFSEKLTFSLEYVRRIAIFNSNKLTSNAVKHPQSSKRYVVSLNYKVGKNQNLSFVYGRDFDQTYIKKGNLIAALNLMLGFGSTRPLGGK